jgi:hypothetical protein
VTVGPDGRPRAWYTSGKEKLRQDIERRKEISDLDEIDDIIRRILEAIDSINFDLSDPAATCPDWRESAKRALIRYQSQYRQVDRRRNDIIRENRSPEERDGVRHKAFVVALNEWNDQQNPPVLTPPLWKELWDRADELVLRGTGKPRPKTQPSKNRNSHATEYINDSHSSSDPR